MMDFLHTLFAPENFMPHGHCYQWEPGLLALHVISDALITASYFSIPFTLLYFTRKRRDLAFNWIFVCFAVFIVACGMTHLIEIWVVWYPAYWVSGGLKAVTAVASVATSILLVRLIPDAMRLPSPSALQKANAALEAEVRERQRAENETRQLNDQLEMRVQDRVQQLEAVNQRLEAEIAKRQLVEADQLRLASIVESSDDAIISKNLEGIITTWNPGAEKVFGYSAAEAVGRPMMIVIPPERAAEEAAILAQIARGESVEHFETTRVRKDGKQIQISATISALRDASGRVVGASKIARDITARKLVESKLRESEERFASVFHDSPVAMSLSRLSDGVIVQANEAWVRLTGFSMAEAVGHSSVEIGLVERETREKSWEILRKTGAIPAREFMLRTRQGEPRTVLASGKVIQIAGEPHSLGSMHDITERKLVEAALSESREEFKDLFDNAPIGYHEVNAEGRLVRINQAELKMLGYSADELLGQFVWKISAEEELSRAALQTKLAGVPPPAAFERRLRRKNGTEFTVLIEDKILKNAAGEIIGVRAVLQDITARKQVEAALRESEDRFRTMTNSMSQLAWIARADGFIIWYNQRWYEYTGTVPEQMEGWGWQSVHDPEVLPKVMENWKASIDSGQPFEMEFPLRGADGQFRIFLTRVQPMKDAEGRVVQWFGTNTDVNVLKQMEESLRATQARLSSTLAAGSIGTWTWDIRNDRLVGDEFTAHAFSLDVQAAAQGLPAAAYLQAVMAEDQQSVSESLAEAIASCGRYDIEYRVRQKNGGFLWLQARGRVEGDAAGNAVSFHGAVMDITARKQAEEKINQLNADLERRVVERTKELADLYNNAPCGYHSLDGDGLIVGINDTELAWLGYARDEVVGKLNATDFLTPESVEIFRVNYSLFKTSGQLENLELAMVRKDGSVLPVLLSATVATDQSGNFLRSRSTIIDYTDRKRVDSALRESQVRLEEANKELEAFSYSVSHDLRAPLRAVDGFSQAVMEDFGSMLPPEGQHQLKTIRESAQRMGELIDDLLAFSRLSRQALRKQPVDTGKLVRTILDDLQSHLLGRRIEIKFVDLPSCQGDPALLKQVWINLLSNALKYTRKRDVAVIEIDGKLDGREVVYSIRDNGTGFDMRYAHKLFGVFQRLHRAEDYEGTGVGLAIVQRVVHRHGGRVWAEAVPDVGATFYFTLNRNLNS